MKEKVEAWVEGNGAKNIFFIFGGVEFQVLSAEVVRREIK